ncbi:MAG: isopenicillin N synthase family oxygenase [Proteobacteria bacterium]|nr:isopenicillin N synthase family oxygenase [Pseudomonadota bacterium]
MAGNGIGAAGAARARLDPSDSIPVVDLGPFLNGGAEGKAGVARAIGDACQGIGFFYLTNHGVPQGLIDALFSQSRRFFALPHAEKMRVSMEGSPNHRGYYPIGGENVDPEHTFDIKEGFDIALELPPDDPDVVAGKPLHGPNQWPRDLPGFRDTLSEYYDTLCGLGRTLCRAFAISLDLPEDFFDAKVARPLTQLRLLRYPPHRERQGEMGAGAHTDYGCVSILAQEGIGGLEVRNSAGEWRAVPPIPGSLVCNVGDMMARWTNDRFAATVHRVVNVSGRDRYSAVVFFDPDYDVEIACLESCQGPDDPPKYPPTTSGEYLLSRFNATYAYREGMKA